MKKLEDSHALKAGQELFGKPPILDRQTSLLT